MSEDKGVDSAGADDWLEALENSRKHNWNPTYDAVSKTVDILKKNREKIR